jgi:putative protease
MELLSPAGNFERLKFALHYGADAVYCGTKSYGLRAMAENFSFDELYEAATYVHSRNKRIYVTVNAFLRNEDLKALPSTLKTLQSCNVDTLIVSDPAVIEAARTHIPGMELHLSTQANTTNAASARFWHRLGIQRIVLARELSIEEIRQIREDTPETLELEAFVHGAMCVSYSGRCLLSNFLNGRDGNRGECVQPCRWQYEIREKGKNGLWLPMEEDERGTYILNSRDLNMIAHLKELQQAGVMSAKIEGRMKTALYVAAITNAYRIALDDLAAGKPFDTRLETELEKPRHRPYTTGFYFGKGPTEQTDTNDCPQTHEFVAMVLQPDPKNRRALIVQKNRFFATDVLERLTPGSLGREFSVTRLETEEGEVVSAAPHPAQRLWLYTDEPLQSMDILRKKL